jgi:hypothetical protein
MGFLMAGRAFVFDRLKHSLPLPAASHDIQLRIVPAFGSRADELFLSFDHWPAKALANFQSELAADQLFCLASLQDS